MSRKNKLIERARYWCCDANIGYSQRDRWNFNPEAGNCDCSSLVLWCMYEAGYISQPSSGYTGNLRARAEAAGFTSERANGKAPDKPCILLNTKSHTAIWDGTTLYEAVISETGGISGKAGDQTGKETRARSFYNYPWDWYLFPPEEKREPVENPTVTSRGIWSSENGTQTRWSDGFIELTYVQHVKCKCKDTGVWPGIAYADDAAGGLQYPCEFEELPNVQASVLSCNKGDSWLFTGSPGSCTKSPYFGIARGCNDEIEADVCFRISGYIK